jgi:hypothetical protein
VGRGRRRGLRESAATNQHQVEWNLVHVAQKCAAVCDDDMHKNKKLSASHESVQMRRALVATFAVVRVVSSVATPVGW